MLICWLNDLKGQENQPAAPKESFRISSIQVKTTFSKLSLSEADHQKILTTGTAEGTYSNNFLHTSDYHTNYHGNFSSIWFGITLQKSNTKKWSPELRIGLSIGDLKTYDASSNFNYGNWNDTGKRYDKFSSKGKFLLNSLNFDYIVYHENKLFISYLAINANIGQASWFSRSIQLQKDSAGFQSQKLTIGNIPVSTIVYGAGALAGIKINIIPRIQIFIEAGFGVKLFSKKLAYNWKLFPEPSISFGTSYLFNN
ncbi:MAG: hypothetical protein H7321_03190 [Bacteroidia bacterium]|nr:hypothetical protein [Bacteroidia bacterium]